MTEEQSSERSGLKLSDYVRIGGFILAIIVFIFGGGFIYNNFYLSKILSYTILPGYDMGDQYFTGVVIENRGRVSLTDVDVIISDLESDIQILRMPGPHQTVNIVKGGEGTNELHAQIPKFFQESSLPIYMITTEPVTIMEDDTLYIASSEVIGKSSSEAPGILDDISSFFVLGMGITIALLIVISKPVGRAIYNYFNKDWYQTDI